MDRSDQEFFSRIALVEIKNGTISVERCDGKVGFVNFACGWSDGLIPVGEDQIISLSAKDQKVAPLPPKIWEPQFPVVFGFCAGNRMSMLLVPRLQFRTKGYLSVA